MPGSRFSGMYLSGRTLGVLLIVIGVAGAMAFYRTHTAPAVVWRGLAHSTEAPLPPSQVASLAAMNQAQEALAEHVAPAVVRIKVTAHSSASAGPGDEGGGDQGGIPPDNPLSQFFGQFGRQFPRPPEYEQGVGSGIIVSPDGFIVTNNHVVEDATHVAVLLQDNRKFEDAKVVGTDPLTDLAVVKINASGLPNLPWGDSKALKQGDVVFAFGNPFDFNFTMTHGIVSGMGRLSPARTDLRAPGDYIQTDAAINPGNSGGPLVDVRGEVVGVNAFIYTATGSFNGEAFAIPSEIAQPISATLIAKGRVVRGYLGINIVPVTPDVTPFFDVASSTQGALVSDITAGQAGAKGGLQVGDIIATFNGNKVADPTELQLQTAAVSPGSAVKLGVLRDGKPVTLNVTLGMAPQDETRASAAPTGGSVGSGVELGAEYADLTPELRERFQLPDDVQGVVIRSVTPGGPAYNAEPSGLAPGLVITDINRVPVHNRAELMAQLQKLPSNKDVLLRVAVGGSQGGASYVVVHPARGGGQ